MFQRRPAFVALFLFCVFLTFWSYVGERALSKIDPNCTTQKCTLGRLWDEIIATPVKPNSNIGAKKIYKIFPPTYQCDKSQFQRIGNGGDGGKWLCGEFFSSQEQCVIMSVGSNGDFSFEKDILSQPKGKDCVVHTFDCTGEWKPPSDRIKFHKWCLGQQDTVIDGMIFKSWSSILTELDIKQVDLLKMDIEGYEWSSLTYMLQEPQESKLPKQILLELHLFPKDWSTVMFKGAFYPPGTPKEFQPDQEDNWIRPMTHLAKLFYSRGYEIASTEFNYESPHECCQEAVFVKTE